MRPVTVLLTLAVLPVAALAADDPRLAQSREVATRFQKELGGRLTQAMSAGGPVEAIGICDKDAPAIAAHYPSDQATGFAAGDLRGAFVIEWPSRDTGERKP